MEVGLRAWVKDVAEELDEVEGELLKKQEDTPEDEEAAEVAPKELATNKVLLQSFTLTFLAEWGDRSQARVTR